MLITLNLDRARLWRWHLSLIAVLSAVPGVRVTAAFDPQCIPLAMPLTLVLQLEQVLSGRAPNPFDPLTPADFSPWLDGAARCDLVIDLAAGMASGAATSDSVARIRSLRRVTPLYGGVAGENALWSHLLDREAPYLALHDSASSGVEIGLPGLEARHDLRRSAAAVVAALIAGLAGFVAGAGKPDAGAPRPEGVTLRASSGPSARGMARVLSRRVAVKARRILESTLKTGPQWAAGWRHYTLEAPAWGCAGTRAGTLGQTGPPGLASSGLALSGLAPWPSPLDPADYTLLRDDGRRYYADPFLFAHDGGVDLFVEELPYATGRGLISVSRLSRDGTMSTPRAVLETPYHLSYPHVFARDGAIWMLPEASASGKLTLYRATRYPDAWEAAACLIEEPLHDATLFEHGGLLWITAATQGLSGARFGSSWDSLSLYWAPRLMGPWTAHQANPVVIDARSARPAGEIITSGGRSFRPVQDCSRGYGWALGIAEIMRLDRDGFAQNVIARLELGHRGCGSAPSQHALASMRPRPLGPHTLNRIAASGMGYEAIDLFGPASVLFGA